MCATETKLQTPTVATLMNYKMPNASLTSVLTKYTFWIQNFLYHFWTKIVLIAKNFYRKTEKTGNNSCEQNGKMPISNNETANELHIVPIPRAKGLPIVGTIFDIMAAGGAPQLHRYIDKRHQALGPIFQDNLGGKQDCVFVASASLMRAVFLHEGVHPRHPVPDAWILYNETHNCRRGLFFMDGGEWLHQRRILNRFLLNGDLHWMDPHVTACTERFLGDWLALTRDDDECNKVNDLESQLYRWAIDVICAIMFGAQAVHSDQTQINDALDEFSRNVHKIFECSSKLMNLPPKLAKILNLKIWQDFDQSASLILQKSADLIDMFLALRPSSDLNVKSTGTKKMQQAATEIQSNDKVPLLERLQSAGMPLAMIKRIFVDLVIAAGDTTAYTTEWALYLLAKDNNLQRRIADEIRADVKDTPLVAGLIKETLRLYPVAPFVGRFLAKTANIEGYHIEQNTLVLLSLYTAGRDANHFPQPLAVKPERWQRDAVTGQLRDVLQPHATLPFAIGNRSCIGRRLALLQITQLLCGIVSNFELECTNDSAELDCVLRMVTVPRVPLQLAVKQRRIDHN